jgi:hypothetical protein
MTTSTLMLPVSDEQDLASWAAVAFVDVRRPHVELDAQRPVSLSARDRELDAQTSEACAHGCCVGPVLRSAGVDGVAVRFRASFGTVVAGLDGS